MQCNTKEHNTLVLLLYTLAYYRNAPHAHSPLIDHVSRQREPIEDPSRESNYILIPA